MAEYLVTSTRLIAHMLMKRIIGLIMVVMLALTAASCYSHRHHPHGMPPGQAKKIYGKKSAKHFAQDNKRKNIKARRGITAIAAITEDITIQAYIGTINGFEKYIKRGYLLQITSFSFR